ncbi:hypothetical protein [Methylobacterium sp.]|uniref:hypothetical protein n=1 Tax=Methylobacterium sp. TaxID=409 RepID=UPI000C61C6C8|nr:hypothetical protein [Methylobacterium sp.]MBP27875.1 hypothetical protein [Methylobacterium sp.]
MGQHTLLAVQSFTVNEWNEYTPDGLVTATSPSDALRIAARAHDGGKPVLVYSRTGDDKVGVYDEARVIARVGEIPNDLVEACLAA